VFEKHIDLFHKDKTYSLILRLSQNVIKAGLRSVATSYSQISFDDIRKKLGLNSNEEAEFVIAKAVSDGVIDARIDREAECMLSQRQADLYCSSEPQKQLHKRIAFSLSLHNDLLKAMQYPDKSATNKFAATDEMDQEEMLAALEAEMDEDDDMWFQISCRIHDFLQDLHQHSDQQNIHTLQSSPTPIREHHASN